MKEGKISSELLKKLVFDNIKTYNEDIIVRPAIGEDCAAIDFGQYACVMSTDPITGADKGAGALAIHISCNDVASSGVKPMGIMITIMLPPTAREEDISRIMKEAAQAAAEINVEIIGGHTEITSAVNRIVISTTAIGKILKEKLVTSSSAKKGDDVIMTKWAGLEGTTIIANDRENELREYLTTEELDTAKSFIRHISVVKEGVLAGEHGVNSMHDVTEGGILGAAWEIAESAGLGIEVDLAAIPLHNVTKRICNYYSIDPYRLISSGCMVITAPQGEKLVKILNENGVPAQIIGKIIENGKYVKKDNVRAELDPPGADELFSI